MHTLNTIVRSRRDPKIIGPVIGYGVLRWPETPGNGISFDDQPVVVYLVQVATASSSLGPACAVLRVDMADEF